MKHLACLLLLVMLVAPAAWAKNVDLSTVPNRDSVQLTIYNSEDITLVRETRTLSFKKGNNPLQFSWANTLIDPTSVELSFKTNGDKLSIADTTFPHDKPQMLYWNVESEFEGQATVQITYFTSGITWSADYEAIANTEETDMHLTGFVRIFNRSGEQYEDAEVRLVVGTINLVEKIAQLAELSPQEVLHRRVGEKDWYKGKKRQVISNVFEEAEEKSKEVAADAKKIVKEALGEYFMYAIPGTETIPNGWAKRMKSLEGKKVPFKIQYRYRPAEYGNRLVRLYLLTNNEDSKLGTTPLPDGMLRVFRNNGREGLSYLTQHPIKYVPIGDKIEMNLGTDPNVLFELNKLRCWRDNIWIKQHNNVIHRVADGQARVDDRSVVVGWDEHTLYTQRIRNFTGKDISVEVRRSYNGHVVFKHALGANLHDYRTPQFTTAVKAGTTRDHHFEVVVSQGRNRKQSNVTLAPLE